jgi:hypothetical protein
MKRTLGVLVLMMLVATGLLLAGSTTEDRAGVEAAVLDYVEGVYEADPTRT